MTVGFIHQVLYYSLVRGSRPPFEKLCSSTAALRTFETIWAQLISRIRDAENLVSSSLFGDHHCTDKRRSSITGTASADYIYPQCSSSCEVFVDSSTAKIVTSVPFIPTSLYELLRNFSKYRVKVSAIGALRYRIETATITLA